MKHNIGNVLAETAQRLQSAGIGTARLDTLILLEDVTGHNRAWVLGHPEAMLTTRQIGMLHNNLAERVRHIPLAYIRKKAFFYGREFMVDERVLVPRPETEAMIDIVKQLPLQEPRIADIGTGSGCIGITAALEMPESRVALYDIDQRALGIARMNAATLAPLQQIAIAPSDLLTHVPATVDTILTNLPYVPVDFPINQAATHEPQHALFAGADGLDAYRKLWQQLAARVPQPRYVLAESLPIQHAPMATYAQPAGYTQRAVEGLIQLFERTD